MMASKATITGKLSKHPTDTTRGTLILTGASGLLGGAIASILARQWRVVRVGFRGASATLDVRVDLTSRDHTFEMLDAYWPSVVVHAAALADVDKCEADPSAGFALNVETTRHLVEWIRTRSPATRLIYISTDQVYSGAGPHAEDLVAPVNIYGLTKYWGEDLARQVENALVVRTNFFALPGPNRLGFVGWIINSLKSGARMTVFDDILFNPLFVPDLGNILISLVESDVVGTLNVGAHGEGISKAVFAKSIGDALGFDLGNMEVGRVAEAGLGAPRPNDMRMSVTRVESLLERSMPGVSEGITRLTMDWQASAGTAGE